MKSQFRIKWLILTFLASFVSLSQAQQQPVPVVLWHGLGDSCCSKGMNVIKKFIEDNIPGVYVTSIKIGSTVIEDYFNGFFKPITEQISEACKIVTADQKLKNGFNAIGLSQGSQFLRGLLQTCPGIKMKNLITLGGQHQGVNGLPNCPGGNERICENIKHLLNFEVYLPHVQNSIVPAQYWNDPLLEETFLEKCIWLPDINNLKPEKSEVYKERMKSLNKFVMIKFNQDNIVVPNESSWFGFYASGQDKIVKPLQQLPIYLNDYLGLKEMDQDGKLVFIQKDGEHLQFSKTWFKSTIMPYLE